MRIRVRKYLKTFLFTVVLFFSPNSCILLGGRTYIVYSNKQSCFGFSHSFLMVAVRRHFIDTGQLLGDNGLIPAEILANDLARDILSPRMPGPGGLSSTAKLLKKDFFFSCEQNEVSAKFWYQ